MKFYHASKKQFTKPDPSFFKEEKDFGPRFYCADNRESAEEYCDDRNCE